MLLCTLQACRDVNYLGRDCQSVAWDLQVAGRVVGRCRGALHKQAARMLAAQSALAAWPGFLTQAGRFEEYLISVRVV